jgi:hypothetical protein
MARLPSPGGDVTSWGALLNDYLLVEHGTDGRHPGMVNVRSFGAKGNGTVNDAPAFVSAMAASKYVFVPDGDYLIGSKLNIPSGVTLAGSSKYATKLLKGFNGDFIEMADQSTLLDLSLLGNARSGRGVLFLGQTGRQTLDKVAITGMDGACMYFDTAAGSQFRCINIDLSRTNAGTGTGRYAIVIDPAQQLAAIPRSFLQITTLGTCAFDFGGACDLYVTCSTLGDLRFTGETRAVNIVGCRIENQANLTVMGWGNSIVGCSIKPKVTIGPNFDNTSIGPGSFDSPGVINNSGHSRNIIMAPGFRVS